MMATLQRSWSVMKQCWSVLRSDRSLAIFPILSAISSIAMLALVFGPFIPTLSETSEDSGQWLWVALGLVALYGTTFLTIFFNVALVSCARRSFAGEDTKVGEGISAAIVRLPQIAAWAFVSFLVGLLLRALDALADELPFPLSLVANIGVLIVGGLWSIVTYLVIPVVAFEGIGGRAAVSRSKSLVQGRWGEAVIGNVSIGLLTFLIGTLPGILIVGLGFAMGDIGGVLLGAVGVLMIVGATVIGSTLGQIYNTALYGYLVEGAAPGSFDNATLAAAFGPRKQKG